MTNRKKSRDTASQKLSGMGMSSTEIIKGKVWKFGDNIDTDQIYPGKWLPLTNKTKMAKHAMEGVPSSARGATSEKFRKNVKKGDILVVGRNFGCGSSREHAPIAIKGVGISMIIAKSFATIFYRNAINVGLSLIECKEIALIKNEDIITVDIGKGEIITGKKKKIDFITLPQLESDIIKTGGLIHYLKSL